MKILILHGSHRKRGNTARVTGMIEQALRELAAEAGDDLTINRVFLSHSSIRQCRGCRVCFNRGERYCPLEDDIGDIKKKMLEADGLVITSPVYVNDVNGVVKNWIDRLAYVCHRPEFAGKCAYIVVTVGDGPTRHAIRTIKMALNLWGYSVVGQAGFKMGAMMDQVEMQEVYTKKCTQIAEDLFSVLRRSQIGNPSFLSLMTFRSQQRYWQRYGQARSSLGRDLQESDLHQEGSIDYVFWRERGWTQQDHDFYIRHNASPLKVAAARITGDIVARFVVQEAA